MQYRCQHAGFFVSLLLPALATAMRMRKKQPSIQIAATGSTTVIHMSEEQEFVLNMHNLHATNLANI